MLRLLDAPSVRRIFITGDSTEITASEVEGLLRNTPRRTPRFGRITVNQGIVVDPKNPNEAIVFILVMDEKELGYLRTRLERELHLSVNDDGDPPASVVTLLADVDQVTSFAGSPPSVVLTSPPPEVAPPVLASRRDENKVLKREAFISPSAPAVPLGAADATSSPGDAGGTIPAPASEKAKHREVARNDAQPSRDLSSLEPSGDPESRTVSPSRRVSGGAAPATEKERSTPATLDDLASAPKGVVDTAAAPPSNPDRLRTVLVWVTAPDTVRSSTQ